MAKMLTSEEYDELNSFLEPRILSLWEHENKHNHEQDYTQTGFPINLIFKYHTEVERECIYVIYNPLFFSMLNNYFPIATTESPELFGTGNAWDVLKALYKCSNYSFDDIVSYKDCLKDVPCYIVYNKNGNFCNDILRLDLFRDIKKDSKTSIIDFIGGLFHALKHFSLGGINLSINKDINEVFDVMHVVYLIAMAFRQREGEGCLFRATQDMNDSHQIVYHFYKEENNSIFFLKTCYKCKKKK